MQPLCRLTHRMGGLNDTAEQIIARIAALQHGVVTRMQLLSAGRTEREIEKRLEKGSLIRVHPGVYRVGHLAPSDRATFLAAVYACGEGAALSGHAGAHLLEIVKGKAPNPGTEESDRRGRQDAPLPPHRGDDLPRHPGHNPRPHPRRPGRRRFRGAVGPRLPRSPHQARHDAGGSRSGPSTAAECKRSRPAASGPARRYPHHAERTRAPLPEPPTCQQPPTAHRWTATATTPPATPGSSTAPASARPTPAAPSSAATHGATSPSDRSRFSANCVRFSRFEPRTQGENHQWWG